MANIKNNKKYSKKNGEKNNKKNSKQTKFIMKLLVLLGIIIFSYTIIYLANYFFVEKSYLKINMSTDKKLEYIDINGKQELITTQKYVSDLDYSMRYDIDNFKVYKYKEQDIYKYLNDNIILVVVEKSSLPSACSVSITDIGYNNCFIKKDNYTEEYYLSTNGLTYKITVKSPNTVEYESGVKTRINYMINNFVINF